VRYGVDADRLEGGLGLEQVGDVGYGLRPANRVLHLPADAEVNVWGLGSFACVMMQRLGS
jgi:hypothetical protein